MDATFRAKLLEERNEARRDTRLKARFLSFRMNYPSADEIDVLLTESDWKLVKARAVPPPIGKPIVGLDLGQGRSWSAAVAVWPNGRCEARAVAPGIPDIEAQERRDRVPTGTYSRLVDIGVLDVARGLYVPPVPVLVQWLLAAWGVPLMVVADRFRVNELRDSGLPCPLLPRVSNYSESSFDIRALRKMARDGPLSCPADSEKLILESLLAAAVKPDTSGNVKLEKSDGTSQTGRDDVAAALVLAAGAMMRRPPEVDAPAFRVVG